MSTFSVSGNLVDLFHQTVFPATVWIEGGRIARIQREESKNYSQYILPGFVDAHVHIESSLLVPTEFARLAVVQGTVASVSDPHEIANVLGIPGIRFMLANAAQTPFEMAFGVPSCVPATSFETAGARLGIQEIEELFAQDRLSYLSEMMNFPGVLAREAAVMAKIKIAHDLGYSVDGHAPGLQGEEARRYVSAGIATDHECLSLEEAKDKLALGMKILIREGSAAKNYEALHPLLASHADRCMFCSDDKHPDDLVRGHINELVRRSVALGYDVMEVLKVACVNPVLHYSLNVGLLRLGDAADLIVVDNLRHFTIEQTYCKGILAAKNGKALLPSVPIEPINCFAASVKKVEDFGLAAKSETVRVIQAFDGQLFTQEKYAPALIRDGKIICDLDRDILKIVVVNRYTDTAPAVALIQNFGLKRGAIASSVAHDSHNIIAVGTTDEELCRAINAIIFNRGGLAVVRGNSVAVLPLTVAGLMSDKDGYLVAQQYAHLDALAKQLGSTLSAPLMTLSFMALLVIPDLKLSDRGLFNGKDFHLVSLYVD
jgi:adenine deaminase